ncbi:MAG: hypothetical protein KBE91_12010 [Bacteroidia bacterium]|nr:hypothetical protein [Bacteroidia bacterium]MBP9690331.1 hypothetical protein [Bacteroidia bacterium]
MILKKTLLNTVKILTVIAVFIVSSCNNPIFDPIDKDGGWCGTKPPINTSCNTTGTIVSVTCGTGVLGNLWIKVDGSNDLLIQPCEQSFQTFAPLVFSEGDRVKFSYSELTKPGECDQQITCLAALPYHKKTILHCITKIPNTDCGSIIINKNATYDNTVSILNASLTGSTLTLKIGYSGCNEQPKSNFELQWNGDLLESLPLQTTLFLNSKNRQMCQAYFTQELCFDISKLKANQNQTVKVKIQDSEVIF